MSPDTYTDSYEGCLWRHIPEKESEITTPFDSRHIRGSQGRWNRPNQYGALYTSVTERGALLEYIKLLDRYNEPTVNPRKMTKLEVEVNPVLDLTDQDTRREFSVSVDDITKDTLPSKEHCRTIADWARQNEIPAIRAPSAANREEDNIILYPQVRPVHRMNLQEWEKVCDLSRDLAEGKLEDPYNDLS